MNISKGRIHGAKKIVLYGPEGIGKSTFASHFPEPIFIDTEGSTKSLDVTRFDPPKDWQDIFDAVNFVLAHPKDYKTVVIDTADWAEMLCIKRVCENGKQTSIEGFGYGKGYTYLQEEFKKLLDHLEKLIDAGINVLFTAHAKMRKFEQPDEMGAYDRWEMKLSRQVAPMVKEWADMVLFANYQTFVVEDDKTKTKKAQGGKRVMYTSHHPCWDAKNREGLPEKLPFEYKEIASVIEPAPSTKATKKVEAPKEEPKEEQEEIEIAPEVMELKAKCASAGISERQVQVAVAIGSGVYPDTLSIEEYDPKFIQENILNKWEGFSGYAKQFNTNTEELPFN